MVEDTTQYVKDGLNHLSDKTIYEEIKTDPTESLSKAIHTYVDKMQKDGIIDQITKEYLTLEIDPPPRTQQLYFLKKIHKNPIASQRMWRTNRENLSTGRLPLKTTCTRDKIVSKRYQPSYILIRKHPHPRKLHPCNHRRKIFISQYPT